MASDFDPGLLGMNLSDSDSDQENSTPTPAEGAANSTTRADRTALSEEAFQLLKATYRPKVENGEVSQIQHPLQKRISIIPLTSHVRSGPPSTSPWVIPSPRRRNCSTLRRSCTSSGGMTRRCGSCRGFSPRRKGMVRRGWMPTPSGYSGTMRQSLRRGSLGCRYQVLLARQRILHDYGSLGFMSSVTIKTE